MKKRNTNNGTITKDVVVLYHAGCHDGFGGAWAAWKKFKNEADYIAVEHGNGVPDGLFDKELYCIDFCYAAEIMQQLLERNKRVIILDHHVSQRDVMRISTEHVYDNNRSGSVIAWQYFFPNEPIPKLLVHIQDVDLWKFAVSHTKELMAALDEQPFDFKTWNKIAAAFEDKEAIKKYRTEGSVILRYEKRIIERTFHSAERVTFAGLSAYAVNSSILESEIGNLIVERKKTVAIIWVYKKGTIRVSLRSNGKTDVSKLAQRYGGGGHKAAAGFSFAAAMEFPWVKTERAKE